MNSLLSAFENPSFTLIGIILLAVIVFIALIIVFVKVGQSRLLVFDNEDGRVEISAAAIQEIITRTCEQFVEVGKARGELRSKRGNLYIKVRLKLRVKTRLQDISNELQRQLTRAIRDDLGIENLADVSIIVDGFLPQDKPKA